MSPAGALGDLQARLLAACTAGAPGPAEADVKPGGSLAPEERLAIYARGYAARLLDCLRGEFPVLRALVGNEVFNLFARGYLAAHPPASPSLFDVGAGFGGYLERSRPQRWGPPGCWEDIPYQLASLERARLEARRAAGVETDPAHGQVDPLTIMTAPGLRLRTPPSLRLLRLDFSFAPTLAAAERGERPPSPAAGETYYAVARSRYRVAVHVLAPWQHAILTAAGQTAQPLDDLMAGAGLDRDALWARLIPWLPGAVDGGVATLVLPGGAGAGSLPELGVYRLAKVQPG